MIYGYNSKLQRDAGFQTTLDFTRGLLHEIRKIRSSEEVRQFSTYTYQIQSNTSYHLGDEKTSNIYRP